MNGWMKEWLDEWVRGWMDSRIDRSVDEFLFYILTFSAFRLLFGSLVIPQPVVAQAGFLSGAKLLLVHARAHGVADSCYRLALFDGLVIRDRVLGSIHNYILSSTRL